MAANRFAFAGEASHLSWPAVLGGVFVALSAHALFNILGLGIGAASVDVSSTASAGPVVPWTAFAWWAIAGVLSAFAGGWAAGAIAGSSNSANGGVHGLLAWCVTTVVVLALAAVATSGGFNVFNSLAGPIAAAGIQLEQLDAEAARRVLAAGMLSSFVALVTGAVAGTFGGMAAGGALEQRTHKRRAAA
jgi:hypothetical protein